MTGPDLRERLATESKRRAKAGAERRTSLWVQLARVGTLGWMVAVPIVVGALAGHAIDRRLGGGIAWAMSLMMLGLASGAYALWRALYPPEEEP